MRQNDSFPVRMPNRPNRIEPEPDEPAGPTHTEPSRNPHDAGERQHVGSTGGGAPAGGARRGTALRGLGLGLRLWEHAAARRGRAPATPLRARSQGHLSSRSSPSSRPCPPWLPPRRPQSAVRRSPFRRACHATARCARGCSSGPRRGPLQSPPGRRSPRMRRSPSPPGSPPPAPPRPWRGSGGGRSPCPGCRSRCGPRPRRGPPPPP
mmetsp:Transcript_9642/g.28995  ORF Transcript_9642/g.28995 Transcript_9642/m.28995 type:complete len:208 (-) Transcript_9642:1801-2424(-)